MTASCAGALSCGRSALLACPTASASRRGSRKKTSILPKRSSRSCEPMLPERNQSLGKPQLLRRLNLLDTTFLVIGAVVGSGIFMTSGYILEYVSSPGWLLLVWLGGGLFTLGGALSCAELGAMYPRAGGQYIYIREAYGSFAGYLYGWGFFWFIMGGGVAALAVGFAEFFGYFFPGLSP